VFSLGFGDSGFNCAPGDGAPLRRGRALGGRGGGGMAGHQTKRGGAGGMEIMIWKELLTKAAGLGFSSLLLLAAVWWLNRGNGSLLKDLKAERVKRLESLEKRSQACEEHREELQKQVQELQSEVRELYNKLAALASGVQKASPNA